MDNRSSNMHQDPATQASEFFIEFRVGDGTPAVRARFAKWLRSSPENVQAYLEIAAGWSELPTADPEGRIDLKALLDALRVTEVDNVIPLRLPRTDVAPTSLAHRTRLSMFAGSLALLLVAITGFGIWVITQGEPTYKTGIGEERTLILADGSTVTLSALTTIRVRMTEQAREIAIVRGQAYFHDIDDPARPFVVRTGRSSVRAIGTEFNVDEQPDRTVVTVLQGQVAVAKSSDWIDQIGRRELLRDLAEPANSMKAVLVSAGQQVTVLAANLPAPSPVDVTSVTAWMQQRLVFDNTPLAQVARQFNLYSKRRLVIADPALRTVGVSGDYSASDPGTLIAFLRSQPMLHVVATDREFIVTQR